VQRDVPARWVRWDGWGRLAMSCFKMLRLGSLFLRLNDEILNERYSTVMYKICGGIGQSEV